MGLGESLVGLLLCSIALYLIGGWMGLFIVVLSLLTVLFCGFVVPEIVERIF